MEQDGSRGDQHSMCVVVETCQDYLQALSSRVLCLIKVLLTFPLVISIFTRYFSAHIFLRGYWWPRLHLTSSYFFSYYTIVYWVYGPPSIARDRTFNLDSALSKVSPTFNTVV